MARPLKDGLDYWPRNVDLREDKKVKLIKAEFSLKGVYLFEEILNTVYRENGYFKKWDDDDCFLMSEGVGCGCTPELITEVLQGCLRRSLFDQRVFQVFGVLTSRGIQKRFLKIVANNRDEIPVIKEYWLLEKRDVTACTFKKLAFFSVSLTDNAYNLKDNPDNIKDNAQRKESKDYKNYYVNSKSHIKSPVLSSQSETDRHDTTDEEHTTFEAVIKNNIGYSRFINPDDIAFVDELVSIMLDAVTSREKYIHIGKQEKSRSVVKGQLLKLTSEHITHVINKFRSLEVPIVKRRQYLLTMLYNTSMELESYYAQF